MLKQLTVAQRQTKCKMINNIRLYKNTVSTLVEHSSTQLINTEHRKVSLNTYIYTVYIDIYRKADLLWREQSHSSPPCSDLCNSTQFLSVQIRSAHQPQHVLLGYCRTDTRYSLLFRQFNMCYSTAKDHRFQPFHIVAFMLP